jgi:quercetin dioxygenase-like cupin family protein
MKMTALPMSITDWTQVEPTKHPGETGFALWRTQTFGEVRVRMVEYSPGYVADHWCSKGHVILCLSGALKIELKDGKQLGLQPGQSYHVGDGDPPHRSSTAVGAKLFIVD